MAGDDFRFDHFVAADFSQDRAIQNRTPGVTSFSAIHVAAVWAAGGLSGRQFLYLLDFSFGFILQRRIFITSAPA